MIPLPLALANYFMTLVILYFAHIYKKKLSTESLSIPSFSCYSLFRLDILTFPADCAAKHPRKVFTFLF